MDELKSPADNTDWFRDAKLNWAENMLLKKWRDDEGRVAMIQVGELPKNLSFVFTQDKFFVDRVLASISDATVCEIQRNRFSMKPLIPSHLDA